MNTTETAELNQPRDLAIDRLRGALVILMVAGDFLSGINWVPAFLKHAPDIGITIADLVAPAFVFVIGLNFKASFRRHLRDGRMAAYRHFMMRYLSLLGIGAVISAGASLVARPTGWGVLEALGIAGLITLLAIRLPTWARFLVGLLMLAGYQYALDTSMLDKVLSSVHGGLFGAISWGALLILSTAVADVWRSGTVRYLVCLGALFAAAGFSALVIPISKNRVSLSYILLTLAISALAFLIVKAFSNFRVLKAGIFCWWGQNSLAMYFLHLLLLGLVGLPPIAWWYADAPAWLATLQLVAILGLLSVVAWRIKPKSRA